MTHPTTDPALRPAVHFSPQRNWMNDPNGLVHHRGVYHLFFQHNPCGTNHGNMSWGHATSTDLLQWEERPLAIRFDEVADIFSGSVVVDSNNTSGFGSPSAPPLVAIYTAARRDGQGQAQALAYSLDDGETWTKYLGNPVLDRGTRDFRDPKVFRYGSGPEAFWVMVAVEAEDRQVLFYRSEDLKEWTFLSSFGPAGAVGGVWECPDLFPLAIDGDPQDVQWVLLISLNPGGVAGGSGTRYILGDFDGIRFTPLDTEQSALVQAEDRPALEQLTWLDWGRDCYAGVTFSGLPDERRVLIAWMNNWDYAHRLPSTWRDAMTLPRQLTLVRAGDAVQLAQRPIAPEGEVLWTATDESVTESLELPVELPVAARVDVRLRVEEATITLLRWHDDEGEGALTWDSMARELALDRSAPASVSVEGFSSTQRAPLHVSGNVLELSMWFDSNSLEVVTADGLRSITDQIPPPRGRRRMSVEVSAGGAHLEQIRIVELAAHKAVEAD